jgi:hypothetical protein
MFQTKKILVTLLIATFLVAIPLSLINTEPEIAVVVNRIEIGTDYGKPPGTPGGGKPDKPEKPDGGKPGEYLLTGYKWENLEEGLTLYVGEDIDVSVITTSAEEWDYYAGEELVNTVTLDTTIDIFDEFDDPETPIYDASPDGNNELVMAGPENFDSGVIAVCYTWYYTDTNEIFQFDIAFNTYFNWGDADSDGNDVGDPNVMDLQNIATHELGHGFGLDDIYKRKLNYLTMYGYSSEGDIAKRTLAQGDIDGIQALYGTPP